MAEDICGVAHPDNGAFQQWYWCFEPEGHEGRHRSGIGKKTVEWEEEAG